MTSQESSSTEPDATDAFPVGHTDPGKVAQKTDWIEQNYPDGEPMFVDHDVSTGYAFKDSLHSFVYGQYYASKLAALSCIEKLLAHEAGGDGDEDHGFGDICQRAEEAGVITEDQKIGLYDLIASYNSDKHYRPPDADGALTQRSRIDREAGPDGSPMAVLEDEAREAIVMLLEVVQQVPSVRVAGPPTPLTRRVVTA